MADLNVIYRIAADISGLQDGVKRAATAAEGLGSTAKKVGGVLAAAFTGLQIKEAALEVVTFSSHVADMAAKVGISAEAVQELDFVAKQSGSSFDQVSQALALMGDRLIGGDKSTVGALETLGLSLTDLQAMSPDKAFEAIGVAISKIEDPMLRSNIALDLFGKSGAALLPTLTSDIGGLRDRAKELGLVMSNDVVRAGDDLDDKFAELEARVKSLKGNALTPLMGFFLNMPTWMQTGVFVLSEFSGALTGIAAAVMIAGGPVAALATLKTALLSLSFLLTLPAGAVVAAVVGLVAIWHQWDNITAIAANVYNAVKLWLVEKFQAIVDAIKAKIAAITGAFKGMYDKVVGNSYVPDMVNEIDAQMRRLNDVMVKPAVEAAGAVSTVFQNLVGNLGGILGQFGQVAAQWMDGLVSGLSAKWQGAVGAGMAGAAAGIGTLQAGGSTGKAIGNTASAAMTAGLGAYAAGGTIAGSIALGATTMGVGLAAVGVYKGIKALMGQSAHKKTNDIRDAWFNANGGLAGVNQAAQAAGDSSLNTTKAIFGAKTQDDFVAAVARWEQITGRGIGAGVPQFGAGGLVRQPTLAMVGEAGPELITPLDKLGSMGLGNDEVINRLDGLRQDMARDRRLAPHLMITAWRDALAHSS